MLRMSTEMNYHFRFFCHYCLVWLALCLLLKMNPVIMSKTGYYDIPTVLNNFSSFFLRRSSIFQRLGWWLHHLRPPLVRVYFVYLVFVNQYNCATLQKKTKTLSLQQETQVQTPTPFIIFLVSCLLVDICQRFLCLVLGQVKFLGKM